MSGGYRAPIPPIFARALEAIDALDKLASKARWRLTRTELRTVVAASETITELRDELHKTNGELHRIRSAVKTLFAERDA